MKQHVSSNRYPLFLLMLCLTFLAAALALPFATGIRRVPFNDQPIRDMEAQQSDFVFIGNSMMRSRIDPNYILSASGKKAYRIDAGPSFVGSWYLWLKNFVAVAKIKPKRVFLFFTDEQLTSTNFWLSVSDAEKIESVMRFQEPVYDRLVRNKQSSLYSNILEHIHRFYARSDIQEPVRQRIANFLMQRISSGSYEDTKNEINNYLKTVGRRKAFDVIHDPNFRPRDVPMTTTEAFSVALTKSFLVPIVQVAKENNLPLCFFRIRRSPMQRREGEPKFQEYLRSLEAYFKANDVCYIDESGDTDVTDDMYGTPSDDHIHDRRRYTSQIFYPKYLKPLQP
jgi:hypothetical protein